MRWRDKASERVGKATGHTAEWLDRNQREHPEIAELALELYRRDRDSFASVLGSALALRLFLFVIAANVFFVGLVSLTNLDRLLGGLFEDSITAGTMAENYLGSSFWKSLVMTVSGAIGLLWAGRTLARSLAICSAAAWQIPATTVKLKLRAVLLVTGLFAGLTFASALFNHMHEVGGLVVGFGTWVAVFAVVGAGTFLAAYALPRKGTDPGALLPGVAVFAAGFAVLQWFMQIWLPGTIERQQDTLGDLAVAVATLGYFFYFGRLLSSSFVLNATLQDRYGTVSDLVFGIPGLRRLPARWPRLRAFFELDEASYSGTLRERPVNAGSSIEGTAMTDELDWTPPGPGPWQRDQSHFPYMTSRIAAETLPVSFARGFAETFAKYGILIDRVQPAIVNGFMFLQVQPFDMPGPDGPKTQEWIGAEFGRRMGVAASALENEIWFDDLALWDNECKPASIARHRELWLVELRALTDAELAAHLDECVEHLSQMVYQHHRFNVTALAPVGDFVLQTAAAAHVSPLELFQVLDGSSPVSGILSDDIIDAVAALRADPAAEALVRGSGDPGARLAALRTSVPAVAEWLAGAEYRVVDGLDVTRPTLAECPGLALGRLATALDADGDEASTRAAAYAASVRERVPHDQRANFDKLLTSARTVNRLRDERALFSDTPAIGILRRAMLEIGRRLVARGRLEDPAEALEAGRIELLGLLEGASTPTAATLQARTMLRSQLGSANAPILLGPPPPEPPPVDQLPPSLARMMGAVGFAIQGVLGQMPEATGTDTDIIGIGIGASTFEGRARVVVGFEDLFELEPGEVLVTPATMESFNAMLHLVGAIVTDHGSYASHAAIMARELGMPAVVGTVDATRRIKTGDTVRVDAPAGQVTVTS